MRIGLDARLAGAGLGVSRLIEALATDLPAAGVEVVWFGLERLAPPGVTEVVSPPGPGFAGLDAPHGRRLAGTLRLDLMHFAANSGWWSPGRPPHLLTVHDVIWSRAATTERSPRQLLGHAYLRLAVPRALRLAAAVATPSATAAADLRARFGASAVVIPNGVGEIWREARADGEGSRPYVVAFAGRDPRKATDVVLEAWRRVAGAGIALVVLAGAGIPRDVQAQMSELRSSGAIEVMSYLSESELVHTVAGALALLYPSRDEGFGLPVAEAMAAGVPVITGLAPVTLEVGGDAVLRLDPRDPAGSAADHLRALANDPTLRSSLAARGRSRARTFSWDTAVRQYRELYATVLADGPLASR